MKIKNVGFLQMYIHRIALGLCAIVTVGILWMYFLPNPYSIETKIDGKMTRLSPDEIEQILLDAAEQLDKQIKPSAPDPLQDIPVPPYTQDFEQRWSHPMLAVSQFEVPLSELGPADFGPEQLEQYRYAVPTPPAPVEVKARADYAVLLPDQVIADQVAQQAVNAAIDPQRALAWGRRAADQFAVLVDKDQPRDFFYVTVGAAFPLEQWRQRLSKQPQAADERPIKEEWWRPSLYLIDVALERQALDPATGQWGATQRIDVLPGQLSFRDHQQQSSRQEAEQTVNAIRIHQDKIARPPFAPVQDHKPWLPPDADVDDLTPDESRELLRLITRVIPDLRRKIEGLQKAQADAKERPAVQPQSRTLPQQRDDDSGRLVRRPAPRADRAPTQTDKLTEFKQRLQQAIARANELMGNEDATQGGRLDGPARDVPGAGYDDYDDRMFADQDAMDGYDRPPGFDPRFAPRPDARRQPADTPSIEDQDTGPEQMTVWAHDLSARPGTTYRYRIVVSLLNPLFKRDAQLNDQQRDQYANQLGLESDASQWVEVQVPPVRRFFLVNANADQHRGTIEVWYIFNGRPIDEHFDVEPGDPIGQPITLDFQGETRTVDLSVGSFVVDVVKVLSTGALARKRNEMLYFDLAENELKRRSVELDEQSHERIRLRQQAAIAGGVAEAPDIGTPGLARE